MDSSFVIYNTLSRSKEVFQPLHAPHVGLYVCGPTVYGDPHLGHARPAITFDLLFRYLSFLNYKVRYVRNITDVGHLVNDADEGEDKIEKKARLDDIEPMEVVQYYTNRYHKFMDKLNVLSPSIEPHASGHIIEQIELVKTIIKHGFAYGANGSVYFDVKKYNEQYTYGKLSGRVLEDLQANTRTLDGQDEKRNSFDFALWKKANPGHIMRWKARFSIPVGRYENGKIKYQRINSDGFPGWHLECSAMSTKYLGNPFDIHGGGMDLMFPHHECEIAQNVAAEGHEAVRYWIHNNMITIDGQKMGKSLGNFITLEEFFTGMHKSLTQAYSPMTIRFFILQAHYRSTLDFSNEALQAAEKGLQRLLKVGETLNKLKPTDKSTVNIGKIEKACFDALNDDLNSPVAISVLFETVRVINCVNENKETLTNADLDRLKVFYNTVVYDILGLQQESAETGNNELTNNLIDFILQLRQNAKINKDFDTSDNIRDALSKMGITVKDTKGGFEWEIN
ncbi:MAG: cysteine--tRNA ligase [Prevotellaceae bacterium]|jgi:cysteinyl-tRNA synthetase|nr:cysteine--tRNA ligase [Prevotellaceae bacterium]